VVGHYENIIGMNTHAGITYTEGSDGNGGALIQLSVDRTSCSVQIRREGAGRSHVEVDCVPRQDPDLMPPAATQMSGNYPPSGPSPVMSAGISLSGPGKWHVSETKSVFDDSPTVVLSLAAENGIRGWLASSIPQLVVRCQEGRTEVYVVTGMSASVEYGKFERHTIRLRYDDDAAITSVAGDSTDNRALFLPDPMGSITRLWSAHSLIVGLTPFNANPVSMEFNVSGLPTSIQPLRHACRW
jgi:hypothetical protein